MPGGWLSGLARFAGALIWNLLSRFMRERDIAQKGKAAGRAETIEKAHDEADKRKADAQALDAEWGAMSDADRERLRNEQGHYRD